jgi:nitrogen fixation protein NifU and related proteins
MNSLRDLYQEVILDHAKKPRNFRAIDAPSAKAEGFNPLCGDRATIFLKLDGDRLLDVAFKGAGCSISTASASIMTEAIQGKTRAEASALFDRFHKLVTGDPSKAADNADPDLGKLAVFAGVCEFPARVKCASLAWHTMKAALDGQGTVSTE